VVALYSRCFEHLSSSSIAGAVTFVSIYGLFSPISSRQWLDVFFLTKHEDESKISLLVMMRVDNICAVIRVCAV
jgi:hypothetical protein